MKNYFRFEFLGWINKMTGCRSKNGIGYVRVQVVNGKDFIFLHCFEDFMCQYDDHLKEGCWVKVKGDICKTPKNQNYYFKPTTIELLSEDAQKEAEPSSNKDIEETFENE